MLPTTQQAPETIDDLYKVEGKAELIGGRIVHFMASGVAPSEIALEITVSLRDHASRVGIGKAFGDGIGYTIDPPLLSGRQSFSPDSSYHVGSLPANQMRFVNGSPSFAVEVRSENDYGHSAEIEMEAQRLDYFQAGTTDRGYLEAGKVRADGVRNDGSGDGRGSVREHR